MKLKNFYLLLSILMLYNLAFVQSPRFKQLFDQLGKESNNSNESDSPKTPNSVNSIFGPSEEKEPENINFSQKSEKANSKVSLFASYPDQDEKSRETPRDTNINQTNQQNNSESNDRSIFGQSPSDNSYSKRKTNKESHNQEKIQSNDQKSFPNYPKTQTPLPRPINPKPTSNVNKSVLANEKSNSVKSSGNNSKASQEISSLLAKHNLDIQNKIASKQKIDDEDQNESDSYDEIHKNVEKYEIVKEKNEKSDRKEKNDRKEKSEKNDRKEKNEKNDRMEKSEKNERKEKSEINDKKEKNEKVENNNNSAHNTEIKKLQKQVTTLIQMNERLMKRMQTDNKSHKDSNRNHKDILNFLQTHENEIESIKDVNHNERLMENKLSKKDQEIKRLYAQTQQFYGDLDNKFKKVNNQVHQLKAEEKKNLQDLSTNNITVKDSLDVVGETNLNNINAKEIDLGKLLLAANQISFQDDNATIKLGRESISVSEMFNSLKSIRKLLEMCGENFEKCIRKEEELHEKQFAQQKDILESLRILKGQTAEILSNHKKRIR